ncbi:hypothetical protein Taro_020722 [Colocasia esculenta]|uniref:Uncharacterized protein n=1 Tax=Colocasia esculenta TaxID=4460 RepID=A0A843UZI4_COLES|nr:hypothetical protein [Colocasia esculenta]
MEVVRVYHWYGLRRRCDRLVPPAVVLVELSKLVLPRGIPQIVSVSDLRNSKHKTKQTHNTRFYPGSDLLSTGVLRPVPEQQLRIPLPRVMSPLWTLTPSSSWSSFNPKGITTPWIPHQVLLQHEGNYNPLDTTPEIR